MKNKDFKNMLFAIACNNRKDLISVIIKYGGDEYESKEDLIELSKMSKKELRLLAYHLFNYLKNWTND